MHVHVSALEFLTTMAYVLIGLFLLRQLAARNSENPFGKGLAAIVA